MLTKKFKLEHARALAEDFVNYISRYCKEVTIAGSIRRRRPEVHDADIVINTDEKNKEFIKKKIKEFAFLGYVKILKFGDKLVSFEYKGLPVDVYFADDKTYETVKLIRTGSADFNKMLCSIAKRRGWKLHANGLGLTDETGKVIENTEEGIIRRLLGKYVPPEEREVNGKV